MKNEHPIDQSTTAEWQALQEWNALLGRLHCDPDSEIRLARLREAIASGEFHVDARAIAEDLIRRLLAA